MPPTDPPVTPAPGPTPAAPRYPAYPASAFPNGVPRDVAGAKVGIKLAGAATNLVTNAVTDAWGRVQITNLKANELNAGRYQVRVVAAG